MQIREKQYAKGKIGMERKRQDMFMSWLEGIVTSDNKGKALQGLPSGITRLYDPHHDRHHLGIQLQMDFDYIERFVPVMQTLHKAVQERLEPLVDFKDRFSRTLMPPEVAACLVPYASLLAEYADAMVHYCKTGRGIASAEAELLARVDRPETECYRLPISLIDYAKRLVATVT